MKGIYSDITKRIKEEPKWYDENGVPRYEEFHPRWCPNIYADEVVLMEIECQECGKRMLVELSWSKTEKIFSGKMSLEERIKKRLIHYGDPPFHDGDCIAGVTMNSIPIRVVQFWRRSKGRWKRIRKLEVSLEVEKGEGK